jgi:RHS repeat-associated protein
MHLLPCKNVHENAHWYKVILEVDGSNNQTGRNIYGVNLLTRTASGATLDYMYNGHADVTALINASGTVAGSYYYDAFGNITEQTGTANNSINYAGYQYDPESKTYYLNARFYDPVTARFLQEDVVRGDVKDPLSLNLYTYCRNEPIMYTDPTGHIYESDKKYLGYNNGYVYHQLEELGIQWQAAKGNATRQAEIKAQADCMRGIADVQIELYLQNYAGVDGNRITVDGIIGKNTAGALNYYTSYTHKDALSAVGIGAYDVNRQDLDGELYNYIITHGVYKKK